MLFHRVKSFLTQLGKPRSLTRRASSIRESAVALAVAQRRARRLGTVGLIMVGVLALNPVVGDRFAQASYDTLFRWRPDRLSPVPQEVIVVRMDDDSREELGQRREFVWDRHLHTRLMENLTRAGARGVVIDLFLADPTPDDPALVEALERQTNVVLGSRLIEQWTDDGQRVQRIDPPHPALASRATALGLMSVVAGRDGVVRRLFPGRTMADDTWVPTLGWAAALLMSENRVALHNAPLANLWLHYYGPPHRTLPSITYVDALRPESAPLLAGRIAVVGSHFDLDFPGSRKDTFPSPWGGGRYEITGVELHATAVLNLLRGEWLQRFPALVELALVTLAALCLGSCLPRLRPAVATAIGLGAGLAVAVLSIVLAWHTQRWWPWLVVTGVQVPAAIFWKWASHVLTVGHEKDLLRRSLATYLSPRLMEEIVAHPDSLRLGGEQRPLAILFTDIADFSRIAGRVEPTELVALLNEYYETAIACIHETSGTVLGILGDGLLAVWNAPVAQPDPEGRALTTARLLRQRLHPFERRAGGSPSLHTRIGLHSGLAYVGNFGSPDRFVYTAIGDAVNLASRLEGLNKILGTRALATRTFTLPLQLPHPGRSLGFFRFKGFDQGFEVLEINLESGDEPNHPSPSTPGRASVPDPFDVGLQRFGQGAFAAAIECFEAALDQRPEDGPARFYAAHCRQLLQHPVRFKGPPVIELTDK